MKTLSQFRIVPRALDELTWATKGIVVGLLLGASIATCSMTAVGRYDTRLILERGRRAGFEQGSKECHTPSGIIQHGRG